MISPLPGLVLGGAWSTRLGRGFTASRAGPLVALTSSCHAVAWRDQCARCIPLRLRKGAHACAWVAMELLACHGCCTAFASGTVTDRVHGMLARTKKKLQHDLSISNDHIFM